ncbi:MAG: hypothetical protein LLG06_20790 [Desulfobacteraceae bacterium]|nr:hypothetical protein [Desulfobacteraceae bacterium]
MRVRLCFEENPATPGRTINEAERGSFGTRLDMGRKDRMEIADESRRKRKGNERRNDIMRRIFVALALSLAMCLASAAVLAQTEPPSPASFHKMGLSGICADDAYLYVMAGGKIAQYTFDMSLVYSVAIPDPVNAPAPPPPPSDGSLMPPPPPMGGGMPHGLYASNGFLYVMAGPELHKYMIPGLVLVATVELPKPEFAQSGN